MQLGSGERLEDFSRTRPPGREYADTIERPGPPARSVHGTARPTNRAAAASCHPPFLPPPLEQRLLPGGNGHYADIPQRSNHAKDLARARKTASRRLFVVFESLHEFKLSRIIVPFTRGRIDSTKPRRLDGHGNSPKQWLNRPLGAGPGQGREKLRGPCRPGKARR